MAPPIDETIDGAGRPWPHWQALLAAVNGLGAGGLAGRAARLDQALAEEGPAGLLPGAASRGWRPDPVPLLLPAAEFRTLAAGLAQRARLLEAALADLHGPCRLLASGVLPPALVYADPRFLRCGALGGGPMLGACAADLLRGEDGRWSVLADLTGVAGGIGYVLQNRRLLARVLPEAFAAVPPCPLDPFFAAWRRALHDLAPAGVAPVRPPVLALLGAGTASAHWFEHMTLARELGAVLVEGGDLTVRDGALFLKTLRGLRPVDVLLRRVAGRALDPLELDAASGAGVAGLLDAVRGGRVRLVNHPGSALAAALGPWLSALCPLLLGEALLLDSAAAGHRASLAPTLGAAGLEPRPFVLRLFLIRDGAGWRVLPGGLARLAGGERIGKDVWVPDEGAAEAQPQPDAPAAPVAARLALDRSTGDLPSRIADDLFWLGRYVERLDSAARLIRAAAARLSRGAEGLAIIGRCLDDAELIAGPATAPTLFAAAGGPVAGLIGEIARLTDRVRDRLTADMHAILTRSLGRARHDAAGPRDADALGHAMAGVRLFCTTLAGLAAENMVRGGGWLFLELGRRIERARAVAAELAAALDGSGPREAGLRLALELCDSAITYRGRYRDVVQPAPVLDLVLADPGNPRGLAFQLVAMHALLEDLGGDDGREMPALVAGLLAELEILVERVEAAPDAAVAALPAELRRIAELLDGLSERIARRYFALLPAAHSLGAPGLRGAA